MEKGVGKDYNRVWRKLYIDLLSITASLSNLYAESKVPFIYYRAMENIFCKVFNADNLSRSECLLMQGKMA